MEDMEKKHTSVEHGCGCPMFEEQQRSEIERQVCILPSWSCANKFPMWRAKTQGAVGPSGAGAEQITVLWLQQIHANVQFEQDNPGIYGTVWTILPPEKITGLTHLSQEGCQSQKQQYWLVPITSKPKRSNTHSLQGWYFL